MRERQNDYVSSAATVTYYLGKKAWLEKGIFKYVDKV